MLEAEEHKTKRSRDWEAGTRCQLLLRIQLNESLDLGLARATTRAGLGALRDLFDAFSALLWFHAARGDSASSVLRATDRQ